MIDFSLKPIEQLVFRSDVTLLAEFHCAPANPLFANSGPANANSIVFPQTTTRIILGSAAFLETPTSVSLYNKGLDYSSEPVSREGAHCAWLTLTDEILLDLIAAPLGGHRGPFTVHQVRADAQLTLRQRSLFRFARLFGDADRLTVEEEAIAIVQAVLECSRTEAADRHGITTALVERSREYLATHYARPVSLAGIARELGVSPAHLSRTFSEATGQTMHAFRDELRLRKSLDFLADCRGDFTRLALDLGYSSHSHFTSRFRKLFGISPSGYLDVPLSATRMKSASAMPTRGEPPIIRNDPAPMRLLHDTARP